MFSLTLSEGMKINLELCVWPEVARDRFVKFSKADGDFDSESDTAQLLPLHPVRLTIRLFWRANVMHSASAGPAHRRASGGHRTGELYVHHDVFLCTDLYGDLDFSFRA